MYQALYRKYRPKNFNDVVGQKYVIETLKNSIQNKKISHAYMFFGPRGIGKTTIAKILSRAVNCENPIEGNPCEKCDSCLKSKDFETVDIIEIDAASNNGVDEIREIRNKVNIVPSELKYKVYIIDEVHMLTPGAFNALLKTLEEPPKHVIFILATTDPQKVSDTIISRCQCYSFKRISNDNIVEQLKKICNLESISIDSDVLTQIAISSNGGLRDALGSLDKISSYKQDLITIEDYLEINDMISKQELEELINIILSANFREFILKINEYNNNGKNLIEIANQLVYILRDYIVDYYLNNKEISFDLEIYQGLINSLIENMFDIKKSNNPKIYIELLILKYMNKLKSNIKEDRKDSKIENKLEKAEKIISREIISDKTDSKNISQENESTVQVNKINENSNENKVEETNEKSNIDEIMKIRLNNAMAEADKTEKINDEKLIQNLNDYVFDQKYGYIVSELLNSKIRVSSKNIIIISYEYDSVVDQNVKEVEKFEKVLKKLGNIDKKIGIITTKKWEEEKQNYINMTKKHQKYDIIEEPELIIESGLELQEESPLADFGDILEIK